MLKLPARDGDSASKRHGAAAGLAAAVPRPQRPRWLRLGFKIFILGMATAALAGHWRNLWGAAPHRLCHAVSPLPTILSPQALHTLAASLNSFQRPWTWLAPPPHRPGHQNRSGTCTAPLPLEPSNSNSSSHPLYMESGRKYTGQGGSLAVPGRPQRLPALLVGGPQLHNPSRPSRAAPRGLSALPGANARIYPAHISSRPTLATALRYM